MEKVNKIKTSVDEFFGSKRIAYATPGTDNHSANFYGDSHVCKLTRAEVVSCIEVARDGWTWDDEIDETDGAIAAILDDLQFDRPKD